MTRQKDKAKTAGDRGGIKSSVDNVDTPPRLGAANIKKSLKASSPATSGYLELEELEGILKEEEEYTGRDITFVEIWKPLKYFKAVIAQAEARGFDRFISKKDITKEEVDKLWRLFTIGCPNGGVYYHGGTIITDLDTLIGQYECGKREGKAEGRAEAIKEMETFFKNFSGGSALTDLFIQNMKDKKKEKS